MATNPLSEPKVESYSPKEEELAFIQTVSKRFMEMYTLKQETLSILDHRNLTQYLNDSVLDYAVAREEMGDPNDPVKPYVTSTSRNKTDSFFYNLSRGMLYPSVRAQNAEQAVDVDFARVCRGILEWAHTSDGYPDESGAQKLSRYLHTMAVEGTVHTMDMVDENGLYSEIVPNSEVYIANYWQPSIQMQPRFYRAKLNSTYEEAEAMFGHLTNFKYVAKGDNSFLWSENDAMKSEWEGITVGDRVHILFVYEQMTRKQLEQAKKDGKISKKAQRHWWYNVIIGGVPMFPVDNRLPNRHGLLNVSVGRFSYFAKSNFYWGESAPNKFRYDKHWRDGWMTLLRHKGKLNALRPQISLDGNFISDEIYIPGNVMNMQEDPKLQLVEGVGEPINNGDLELLRMADREIEASSVSSIVEGQSSEKRMTAREATITRSSAQVALDAFSQQVAYFVQSRTFPVLLSLFEELSTNKIKKLVLSDQMLEDGTRGELELRFERLKKPGEEGFEDEYREKSMELASQARKNGGKRETILVNRRMLDEITLYLRSDTASFSQNYDELRREAFNQRATNIYLQRPEFNAKEVARALVRANEDDEALLATEEQTPQLQPQGAPPEQEAPAMGTPADANALLEQTV